MSAWNSEQLFSSKSVEWATPDQLFDALDHEFQFDLDAAASSINAKCPFYLDQELNSLDASWHIPHRVRDSSGNLVTPCKPFSSIFLNPPWGRGIGDWLNHAYQQSRPTVGLAPTVVCLIPACTDTQWWRDFAWKAAEIRLLTGRLKFVRDDGHTGPSPKGACLAIFTPWAEGPPRVTLRGI